jgi:hypothetical protein
MISYTVTGHARLMHFSEHFMKLCTVEENRAFAGHWMGWAIRHLLKANL